MLTVFYEKLQLALEYFFPPSLWALFRFRFYISIYMKDHFLADVFSTRFLTWLNRYNTKHLYAILILSDKQHYKTYKLSQKENLTYS